MKSARHKDNATSPGLNSLTTSGPVVTAPVVDDGWSIWSGDHLANELYETNAHHICPEN